MSTLPCVKLRAIVDAAREISQLHEAEHNGTEHLGADEFLPIFIFCVVRAEMERPCALSKSPSFEMFLIHFSIQFYQLTLMLLYVQQVFYFKRFATESTALEKLVTFSLRLRLLLLI